MPYGCITYLEFCWRLKVGKAAQCIFVHFFASTHEIGIFTVAINIGQALVSLRVNQALGHHSSHGWPQGREVMEQLEKQVSCLDHLKLKGIFYNIQADMYAFRFWTANPFLSWQHWERNYGNVCLSVVQRHLDMWVHDGENEHWVSAAARKLSLHVTYVSSDLTLLTTA